MQLKKIEDGGRLFDRHLSGMYPGATDSLILWFLTYGHALLAAARNEVSARARADKAEAELNHLRKYTQFLIDQSDSLISMVGPNEDDDWCISVRADDLRRLERAADLARAALKGKSND